MDSGIEFVPAESAFAKAAAVESSSRRREETRFVANGPATHYGASLGGVDGPEVEGQLSLDVCAQCHEHLRQSRANDALHYTDATLLIERTDPGGGVKGTVSNMMTGLSGTRRQMISRRGRVEVTASASDTVYDLKLKICATVDVAPLLQRLFHEATELTEASLTLAAYGIPAGATLKLEKKECNESDEETELLKVAMGTAPREEGFTGTVLTGGGVSVEEAPPLRRTSATASMEGEETTQASES